MPYDEALVTRVRAVLAGEAGITERRMMGGLVFLKDGNMLGGVDSDGVFVRVEADAHAADPHVSPMTIGGRATKSFVSVDQAATRTDADLERWVRVGLASAVSAASGRPARAGRRRSRRDTP